MLLASGLTVSFLLAGISAYRWLRGDRAPEVLSSLRTGVTVAAVLIPLQIIVGDLHGLNTLHHQPAKIAAMEGIWKTERGAPAVLFAVPNATTQQNDFEISVPKLASIYLTHDAGGEVKGIDAFAGKHPPVAPMFFAFRIMVGVGLLMLAVSWLAVWQLRRRGEPSTWVARALLAMTFSGWIALIAGWYTTEIGRQPYLVYGVLTTAEAASKVPATMIGTTLAMYLMLYLLLIAAYISVVFYLARKAAAGPSPDEPAIKTPQPMIPSELRSAE
jgi:cytochrome d ubiquinol oxidase subunit I